MIQQKRFYIAIVISMMLLAAIARQGRAQYDLPPFDYYVFLPFVPGANGASPSAIVIDHRHTDVSAIPAQWITAAKQLTVHYAHTSHGSQVLDGLNWLEQRDPVYSVNIEASGDVVHPQQSGALNVYDGNNYPDDTYILPGMYWESADGLSHTRSVVDTGWFDVSLWTWCGQMSTYSDAQVQDYLDKVTALKAQYPQVRFIFYTGHNDGNWAGSRLLQNNNRVRQYVQQHGGVLFDFADIESYDPDGIYYPNASDACEWCDDWCAANPTHFACQSTPTGCAHTDGLQCTLKGQAFWQLLARLSGWDGNSQ
jgi:hypothetical protein